MVSLRPAVRIESVEVGNEARSLSLCDLGEKQNLYHSRHQNQKSPAVFVPAFLNSYLNEIAFFRSATFISRRKKNFNGPASIRADPLRPPPPRGAPTRSPGSHLGRTEPAQLREMFP